MLHYVPACGATQPPDFLNTFSKEADATRARFDPSLKTGMHSAPFGKIARQGTPSTTGVRQIGDGARIHFAWCRAFTGAFQQERRVQIVRGWYRLGGFSVHADSFLQQGRKL